MFSNSSPMNVGTANSLSSLLTKSGYIEAAHVCHLLFGTGVFGPHSGIKPTFELLGSDSSSPSGFGRDMDSVLLSLVMEFYKISMEPTLPATPCYPHLILYKLNLISYLADRGNITEALAYFDTVTGIVKAASKNLSYSPELFDYIAFMAQRLNLNGQDESSSSWISNKLGRPNLDKVLGKLDKSFSNFITGGDDPSASAQPVEQDGIFKRLAETPMPSRAQSIADLHGAVKQPLSSNKGRTPSGNPYAPSDSDIFHQDPHNYQPQTIPSRSQSSVGFGQDLNNFSPPQATSFREPRPYSPSYGISRRQSEATGPIDVFSRSISSTVSRSRGSSITHHDLYHTHPPQAADPYGTSTASRQNNNVYGIREGRQDYSSELISSSSLHTADVSHSPYAPPSGKATPSNPYAPSVYSNPGAPYNPYAPQAVSSSSLAPSERMASPSVHPMALSRSNSSIPYLPDNRAASITSIDGRQSVNSLPSMSDQVGGFDVNKPANSNHYNHYAPSPTLNESRPNAYAPAHSALHNNDQIKHNTGILESRENSSAPSPAQSYGAAHNPYDNLYGYSSGGPSQSEQVANPQEGTQQQQQLQDEPYDSEYSQSSVAPYEPPQYGYRNDETNDELVMQDYGSSEPSSQAFAPLGAPTFMSATYDPPADIANPPPVQQNILEEDEEIEDLGFSNNSMQKKEENKPKEQDGKEKKLKDKKSGWFSWIRKETSEEKEIKATQIKFGEEMSLVYDPVLKRYTNKNAPKEDLKPAPAPPPPPPMGGSQPPPSGASGMPPMGNSQFPPAGVSNMPHMNAISALPPSRSVSAQPLAPSSMYGSSTPISGPNSARNTPSIPTSGGLDDLLAAAPPPTAGRKAGRRNARSRYVDIMSQPPKQ